MYLKRLDEEESKDKSGYLLNLSDVKDYKIDTPKQQISQDILMNMRDIY